jgi:hypothetical protein
MRIMAVFPHSIPVTLLHQLATMLQVRTLASAIQALLAAHLLVGTDEGTQLAIQPEIRSYLLTLLQLDERQTLPQAAGDDYTRQGDYLEAARQFCTAGQAEKAASLLIEHQRTIVDNLQIEELSTLVAQFRPADLSTPVWARLKIVAGELAEFTRDLDTALAEYQQALNAPDLQTKATASYHRAKAFEHKNIDESLAHYAYAIQLLEQTEGQARRDPLLDALLVRMYIQRAWIFIQVRPDLDRAATDLRQAQARIDMTNRQLCCDLYNALGEYHHRRRNPAESVQQ